MVYFLRNVTVKCRLDVSYIEDIIAWLLYCVDMILLSYVDANIDRRLQSLCLDHKCSF